MAIDNVDYQIHRFDSKFKHINYEVQKEISKKKVLQQTLNKKQKQKKDLQQQQENAVFARELLLKATDSARENGKKLLEETTTHIVQMVFGKGYEIKIELAERANQPIANVYFKKMIGTKENLINVNNEGGGLRDIVSLSFFIAVSEIVGNNRAIIALDEPTPGVSVGHAEDTAKAIVELTKYANKQALIITHEREYLPNLIDKVYYVEQSADGVSKVEEL